MPIFSNTNNILKMLNVLPLGTERKLQKLLESNLEEVLDMKFIASEYMTTAGGRIDTLAIDNDGAPVILEFKRNQNDNVINQALSYLKWLKAQRPEFFKMLMIERFGKEAADKIKLDWKNPRVICIAESFNSFDRDTVEVVPLRIDLFKYRYYDQGLFSLDLVNIKEERVHENAYSVPHHSSSVAIIDAMKEQGRASHAISALFDDLRHKIMQMDEYILEKPGMRTISYALSKKFAEIQLRKDRIVIDLRSIEYSDPKNLVEKNGAGYTVTLNRRIMITETSDLDYVVGIIDQSYQNVL
jgi:predicted transport protein